MSICQREERAAGRPYPRTCPTCKLGPCSRSTMTTDPKDAEIARLTAELAESEAAVEGAFMILAQTQAERDKAQTDLGRIIMSLPTGKGERAAGAVEGVKMMRARLEAERDAALAQVAMTVFCADCENTTTRTDDDRCSVCGSGRIMAGKAPSAALSRRDAQMRAEGMRKAAALLRSRNVGMHPVYVKATGEDADAILAAAEVEAARAALAKITAAVTP